MSDSTEAALRRAMEQPQALYDEKGDRMFVARGESAAETKGMKRPVRETPRH